MAATWIVTQQRQHKVIAPNGALVDAMEVTAQLASSGTVFSVDVPMTAFNADTVKAMLDERASTIEAVHAL